jgi:ferredoxin
MMLPALVTGFTDLGRIRHDFPVVLANRNALAHPAQPLVTPLARVIDLAIAEAGQDPAADRRLRRDAYRLEKRIKQLDEDSPGRSLAALWRLAARGLLRATKDEARREIAARNLKRLRASLPLNGAVLNCGAAAARSIVEAGWQRELRQRRLRHRDALDGLILRLSQALEAERAESSRATSAAALSAALGDGHSGGIDPRALSQILRHGARPRGQSVSRSRRLRQVLRALRGACVRLDSSPRPTGGWVEAVDEWRRQSEDHAELLRVTRMAAIELENRYCDDRHAALFAGLERHQLTPCERRASAPLLLYLDSERMDDRDLKTLLEALAGDLPLKVFLAIRRLPGAAASATGEAMFVEWPARIGSLAIGLGNAFIVQAAASQLAEVQSDIVAALAYEGPALLAIYTGDADATDTPSAPAAAAAARLPAYLRCAAAVESRAFPALVFDPQASRAAADRLSLSGNPQADRTWASHRLAYEDEQGRPAERELAFTAVEFLALDGRFAAQLTPETRSHPRLMTVADYLAQEGAERSEALPYTHVVDEAGRLRRAIVGWELISYANHLAGQWRALQELAGLADRPSAVAPVLTETAGSEAEGERPPTDSSSDVTDVPAATGLGLPPAISPNGNVAYIDTPLCTTCDECTGRNPRMFAYNEAKQAFVRDPDAGTYRELVEAAEICPVCIIHPGMPRNQAEPGLDELIQRAAAFS